MTTNTMTRDAHARLLTACSDCLEDRTAPDCSHEERALDDERLISEEGNRRHQQDKPQYRAQQEHHAN